MKKPLKEHELGFLKSQTLALKGAHEIGSVIKEGWSEKRCAELLDTWYKDNGVTSYFHAPFAWIGERTRFDGVNRYRDFMPSNRVLRPGEIFILDAAPIVEGYASDIGVTFCLGENKYYTNSMAYLEELKMLIPKLFTMQKGSEIYSTIEKDMKSHGYENIHRLYPLGVLGHKLHKVPQKFGRVKILRFGWQSFFSLLSKGLYGQLLTKKYNGSLDGLWAIEPHLGGPGFGAKFEEILHVDNGQVYWLKEAG